MLGIILPVQFSSLWSLQSIEVCESSTSSCDVQVQCAIPHQESKRGAYLLSLGRDYVDGIDAEPQGITVS